MEVWVEGGTRLSFAANTCVRALCGLTFWHAEHVANLPPCVAACVVCVCGGKLCRDCRGFAVV